MGGEGEKVSREGVVEKGSQVPASRRVGGPLPCLIALPIGKVAVKV